MIYKLKYLIFKSIAKILSTQNSAKFLGVILGKNSSFGKNIIFGSEPYLITIGDDFNCASNINFITHDGAIRVIRNLYPEYINFDLIKNILIGNNVFIGMNVTILPGTTIGDNVIIGAGSLVKGDVPSNCVYAGVPAKYICSINEYLNKNKSDLLESKQLNYFEKKKYFKNTSNKKVAFLINSLTSGGAERVVSIVVTELKKTYGNIEVICVERNNFYILPENVKITYLSDNTGTESAIRKLLSLPLLAMKLKQYIKDNNITLVQSHVYRANFINSLSRLAGSKHIIQMVNAGQVSMYKSKGIIGKVNLFLIKRLYPLASTIICKSKGMEVDLQKYFKIKLNTVIINNPYDIEKINQLKKEPIEDFTFDKSKKYLIYVGRFDSFKRPEHVIESLKNLNSNVELILLGDGPKKDLLLDLSEDLNLFDRVHFIGRVANPYKYMNKSDIFILSSNDGEGFPNVLAEAMVCMTAVISTDCKSGPREILSPSTDVSFQLLNNMEVTDKGILIPVGDVKLMSDAINMILENPNKEKEFIKNAYERSTDFSLDTIITKYKKVLELE